MLTGDTSLFQFWTAEYQFKGLGRPTVTPPAVNAKEDQRRGHLSSWGKSLFCIPIFQLLSEGKSILIPRQRNRIVRL